MIRVVTDSSCDLPPEVVADLRVSVVPLTIRFGDDEFVDGIELGVAEFWERVEESDSLPETATPSVGRFRETYRSLVSEGADGIVVVCISEKMSATAQSARMAAEQVTAGVPITVIDSGTVTMALGFAVMAAAERAKTGGGFEAVEAAARDAAGRSHLFAVLDTLDHLRRGGRIGGAQALIGDVLKVKPLITIEDGEVQAAGRTRTRKRAVAAILDHIEELEGRIDRLGVIHSGSSGLDTVVARVAEATGADPIVSRLGPVVGTHAGPGVLGVVALLR